MNKYGAKKHRVGAESFDSKREAKRYGELIMLERAGLVKHIRRQVAIPLEGKNGPIMQSGRNRQRVYKADFVYWDTEKGCEVIEDAKGFPTPEYKLKKAILKAQGVEVKEV